jgi:hypothetical protein
MGSFIQELIRNNELCLWHDYRAGHCRDLSSNSNDGIINGNVIWEGDGLRFVDSTAHVEVSHHASLNLTNVTMVLLKPKQRNRELSGALANSGLLSKNTGGVGTAWARR